MIHFKYRFDKESINTNTKYDTWTGILVYAVYRLNTHLIDEYKTNY